MAADKRIKEMVENETLILRELNHRNIVGFQRAYQTESHYIIILEFVEGEPLSRLLKRCDREVQTRGLYKNLQVVSHEKRQRIMIDIYSALSYLDDQNVLHRDFNPNNIIITPRGGAKIIDFGLAIRACKSTCIFSGGSRGFVAPEVYDQ